MRYISYVAEVLKDYVSLTARRQLVPLQFTKREGNRVANLLAKHDFSFHEFDWLEDFPHQISPILHDDVNALNS